MKTSKIIAAAALCLIAAVSAQAETYQGVLATPTFNNRATVAAEAVVAAHTANPYAEGANAGVAPVVAGNVDRASVQREAVAAARAGDVYAEGASAGVAPVMASNVDRATVRAEARAAARSNFAAL
ncbi:helicase SNF2 [Variovorax ginsengisoli]|uniref:Helicase SNF2 n=1 Tax=Variovorax ginsengisoli TaxID=363844 RepID=A0ABT9S2Q5_9BURK|nr:helicase SNF2 [Variovorax ginsengisoli]MDP9898630.1 hypothetical protein [Variovorax ginsengisoli]